MNVIEIMGRLKSCYKKKFYLSQQIGKDTFQYSIDCCQTDETMHDIIDVLDYLINENIQLKRRLDQLEVDHRINGRIR